MMDLSIRFDSTQFVWLSFSPSSPKGALKEKSGKDYTTMTMHYHGHLRSIDSSIRLWLCLVGSIFCGQPFFSASSG